MTLCPAANIWGGSLAALLEQAGMPSAAFWDWPLGRLTFLFQEFLLSCLGGGRAPQQSSAPLPAVAPGAAPGVAGAQHRPGAPTATAAPQRQILEGTGGVLGLVGCVSQGQLPEKEEIDHPNNSFSPCSIHDRKCLQKQQAKRVNNGNKMRSSGSPHHREDTRVMAQGSCQSELHRALERLAASQTRTHEDLYVIPIPNCDRNGNFHPKQCHPALDGQRGKCWCVDRKTGVKLPGFLELKGDLDCHQLADSM
ncbi:insulin-like growth factor-binding protein 4 isoform X2 [Parus major]|uniref:insulin-like growth factor-binding protein 4 isoform X2 n=1 Tax=Parus major TaxID=9157 RepID=UPI000771065B|nr:insulin-like growth factor-binding protein 4 isoform X2 [Parus major]